MFISEIQCTCVSTSHTIFHSILSTTKELSLDSVTAIFSITKELQGTVLHIHLANTYQRKKKHYLVGNPDQKFSPPFNTTCLLANMIVLMVKTLFKTSLVPFPRKRGCNGIALFPYSAFCSFLLPYSLEPDIPTPTHKQFSGLIAASRHPLVWSVVTNALVPLLLPASLLSLFTATHTWFAHLLLCAFPIHNTCASVPVGLCLCHLRLISSMCSFVYSAMCPVWLYQVKENLPSDLHPHHMLHM